MKNKIIAISLIFLFNSCSMRYTEYIMNLTDSDFDNKKLKTQGYFYNEFDKEIYLHHKDKYGYDSIDYSKKYTIKHIQPILLSPDNEVFRNGERDSSHGIKSNLFYDNSQFMKDCDLSYENSVQNAMAIFECSLLKNKPRRYSENKLYKADRFITKGDTIIIQHYSYRYRTLYIYEKKGIILNDSTFTLDSRYDYATKKTKSINEFYKFKSVDNLWVNYN